MVFRKDQAVLVVPAYLGCVWFAELHGWELMEVHSPDDRVTVVP